MDSASLRSDLQAWIKDKSACFDFMVQVQRPDKNMPVEDPTVEWKESDSPFIVVAAPRVARAEHRARVGE